MVVAANSVGRVPWCFVVRVPVPLRIVCNKPPFCSATAWLRLMQMVLKLKSIARSSLVALVELSNGSIGSN